MPNLWDLDIHQEQLSLYINDGNKSSRRRRVNVPLTIRAPLQSPRREQNALRAIDTLDKSSPAAAFCAAEQAVEGSVGILGDG